MSEERILVTGSPTRAGIVGAYLASRWLSVGRVLTIAVSDKPDERGPLVTRPSVHRFHGEMGLPIEQLAAECGGVPAFATEVQTVDGDTAQLPFSTFGVPRGGVEFHQYWQRAHGISPQADLTDFSLSLALENAANPPPLAQLSQLPAEFGLTLDRAAYANALLSFAKTRGASVINGGAVDGQEVDLLLDCSGSQAKPEWREGALVTGQESDIAGMEWHVMSSAARRLANLAAPLSDCAPEQREWTRLARAEQDRIADMEELLRIAVPAGTKRPALLRKTQVFAACGRIPTEDYEVFSAPEWLAALWVRGIRPRRYDRMAERLPEAELMSWMVQLRQQITNITERVQAA